MKTATDNLTRDDMKGLKFSPGATAALKLASKRKAGSAKPVSAALAHEVGADWVMVNGRQIVIAERERGHFVAFPL